MTTPLLALPEISENQASKYVTHNSALDQLEGMLVHAKSRTTTAEPGSPTEGDVYIIPASATGTDWAGEDGNIGHYISAAWTFYSPTEGLDLWVDDENQCLTYDGSGWVLTMGGEYQILSKSVAGSSNVTLTTAEEANQSITLTGALTGNIIVYLSDVARRTHFYNNTSGAFTVTITPTGGSGAAITQGKRVDYEFDGGGNSYQITSEI